MVYYTVMPTTNSPSHAAAPVYIVRDGNGAYIMQSYNRQVAKQYADRNAGHVFTERNGKCDVLLNGVLPATVVANRTVMLLQPLRFEHRAHIRYWPTSHSEWVQWRYLCPVESTEVEQERVRIDGV